jgi:hypothetical protein
LQDPITGMTALRREGVFLTKQQQDQAKAFVQSGQIVKAQAIILAELTKEVGGSAEAQEKAAGNTDVLRESLRNLAGEYAQTLKPDIDAAVKSVQGWIDHLQNDEQTRERFRQDVEGIVQALKDLVGIVRSVTDELGGTKNTLELLIGLKVAKIVADWTRSFTLLAGAKGAGGLAGADAEAAGLLGTLGLLSKLGPIAIPIAIGVASQKPSNFLFGKGSSSWGDWLFKGDPIGEWVGKHLFGWKPSSGATTATASAAPPGYTGPRQFRTGTSEVSPIPRGMASSVGAEHPTANLPGFPAVDIFAKPGTPVVAPEDGVVTKLSGHDPSLGGQVGGWYGWSVYLQGAQSGYTYYITHMLTRTVSVGDKVRAGQVIGTSGAPPGVQPHIHFGVSGGTLATAGAIAKGPAATTVAGSRVASTPPRNPPPPGKPGKPPPDYTQGANLQFGRAGGIKLTDAQQRVAQMIFDAATSAGLTPEQALEMVAAAYAESKLGAASNNVFQITRDNSAWATYQRMIAQGVDPATASTAAIMGQYVKAFKKNPNAAPGEVAGMVERPSNSALASAGFPSRQSFYTQGIGSLFRLSGVAAPGKPTKPGEVQLPGDIQEALARAGTTKQTADDIKALGDALDYLHKKLTQGGLTQTQRVGVLGEIASLQDQLTSARGLATGAAVRDVADQVAKIRKTISDAKIDDVWAKQLDAINKTLAQKTVKDSTLDTIRERLGKISDAVGTAIDKAKQELQARQAAFDQAWGVFAQNALDAFDQQTQQVSKQMADAADAALSAFDAETAKYKSPARAALDAMLDEDTQRELQDRLKTAQEDLAKALQGASEDADSVLNRARDQLNRDAIAHALDVAQSRVLGGTPADMTGQVIGDLQAALRQGTTVDPEQVKSAQKEVDDAQRAIREHDLEKQADMEESAYQDQRAAERAALAKRLADEQAIYAEMRDALRNTLNDQLTLWQNYARDLGLTTDQIRQTVAAVAQGVQDFPDFPKINPATGQFDVGDTTPLPQFGRGRLIGMASGGTFQVNSRTFLPIVAGEAGPESVTFTPLRGSGGIGGDGAQTTPVVVHIASNDRLLGELLAKAIDVQVSHPATVQRISGVQGKSANRIRRERAY